MTKKPFYAAAAPAVCLSNRYFYVFRFFFYFILGELELLKGSEKDTSGKLADATGCHVLCHYVMNLML